MTVQTRNLLYWTMLIWLIFAGLSVSLLAAGALFPDMIPTETVLSQFITSPGAQGTPGFSFGDIFSRDMFRPPITDIFRIGASSLLMWAVSLISAIIFLRFFRRITASQLLFLYLGLFSLSGELLRILSIVLQHFQAELSLIVLLSRLNLAMYLIGLMSGFTIGLYLLGVKYQHQGMALLLIFTLALGIAFVLPMNTLHIGDNALFESTMSTELHWAVAGIIFVSFLGFFSHLADRFSRPELARVISLMLLLSGQALFHFGAGIVQTATGMIMITVGLLIYFIRLFYDYFWY